MPNMQTELLTKAIERVVTRRQNTDRGEPITTVLDTYGWLREGYNSARWSDANVTVFVMIHERPYRWSDPTGRFCEERPKYSAAVTVMSGGKAVPVWATRGELRGPAWGAWPEPENMVRAVLGFASHALGEESEYSEVLDLCECLLEGESE